MWITLLQCIASVLVGMVIARAIYLGKLDNAWAVFIAAIVFVTLVLSFNQSVDQTVRRYLPKSHRFIALTNSFGQVWTVLRSDVTRIGPDFADPNHIKVWLSGGLMLDIPIQNRAAIEEQILLP